MPDDFIFLPQPREVCFTGETQPACKPEIIINSSSMPNQEGYILTITASGVRITAHDKAGVFYARQTLKQLETQSPPGTLPAGHIKDWPDFKIRGIMLDVSRDRVPTMETMYKMIDMFAAWKLNHLELYIEHTFAYKKHREVWKDASPFTAEEIRLIDGYCKERFIELVPLQNSFGHMHRWLKHENYWHLAECPEGWPTPWGMSDREPFSLCPIDPEVIEFLGELYDEYLPNFSSDKFMVGCDETVDLGEGRSKEYCKKLGSKGKLYLEFLKKLHMLVTERGKRMMYYGDVIVNYPELLSELPEDAILMHWGYYAGFPPEKDCKMLSDAKIPFCLLTSNGTYSSVSGRTNRAMGNIRGAALKGKKYGALGIITTEWGDNGHWQPFTISIPGYAYGAAMSWCPEANENINTAKILEVLLFKDNAGIIGQLLYDLGNCYLHTSSGNSQVSNLYLIAYKAQCMRNEAPFKHLTAEKLKVTLKNAEELLYRLELVDIQCEDGILIKKEIRLAIDFVRFACNAALSLLTSTSNCLAELPEKIKQPLLIDLNRIMQLHEEVWKKRSREGGLKDSLWWYEQVIAKINNPVKVRSTV